MYSCTYVPPVRMYSFTQAHRHTNMQTQTHTLTCNSQPAICNKQYATHTHKWYQLWSWLTYYCTKTHARVLELPWATFSLVELPPPPNYTHTHTRTHTHKKTHIYAHTRMHTHARTHARTHTHTRTYTHAHTYIHTHTYIQAFRHTHFWAGIAPYVFSTCAHMWYACSIRICDHVWICNVRMCLQIDQLFTPPGQNLYEIGEKALFKRVTFNHKSEPKMRSHGGRGTVYSKILFFWIESRAPWQAEKGKNQVKCGRQNIYAFWFLHLHSFVTRLCLSKLMNRHAPAEHMACPWHTPSHAVQQHFLSCSAAAPGKRRCTLMRPERGVGSTYC